MQRIRPTPREPASKERSRTIPFRSSGASPSEGKGASEAKESLADPNSTCRPPVAKLKNSFRANLVMNTKYNIATFLPIVFYEQFKLSCGTRRGGSEPRRSPN